MSHPIHDRKSATPRRDPALYRRLAATLALFVLFLASGSPLAQSVANGNALFQQYCQSCHGNPPSGGAARAGNNPAMIRNAINGRVPDMRSLSFLTDPNLADIAAWIASLSGPPPPPPPPVPARDYTDLWYGGEAESGWGLNIIQHSSNVIFAVMYTYDANRHPVWFVLPGGTWSDNNVFTGGWYRVTGKAYNQAFAPVDVRQVGSATLTFFDAASGSLTFTLNGTSVTKPMTRQPF